MALAATNHPSEPDEAILRHLPQAFEIGVPDREERAAILKLILKDERVEENIDLDSIAAICEGYTGSDLLELCKQAAYFPIRDLLEYENQGMSLDGTRPLSQADLEKVVVTSKNTRVAASEYSGGLGSQSEVWSVPRESDHVQAAISELSKIVISQILNIKSDSQDREDD